MFPLIFLTLLLFSIVGFTKGLSESKKGNAYGKAGIFNILGAFVWGDTVVFGIFWSLVFIYLLLFPNQYLFFLIVSVFWVVRSLGETIYWLNQQFSKIERNPPKKLWFYRYFKNDSVWFIYQIYWQCILVISTITSIYFANLWLNS